MKFLTLNNLTYSELNQKTYADLEKSEIVAKPIIISLNESSLELKADDVKSILRITLSSKNFRLTYFYLKRDKLSGIKKIIPNFNVRKVTLISRVLTIGIKLNPQFGEAKLRINYSTIKLNEAIVLKFEDASLELKKLKNIPYELRDVLDIEAYKLDFKYNYIYLNGNLRPVSFINCNVVFNMIRDTEDNKYEPEIEAMVYMPAETP